MDLKGLDVSNLDINNIGNWPIPIKMVAILLLCGGLVAAGVYYPPFDIKAQLGIREQEQAKETQLKEEFKTKQWKAATLPKLKEQLTEIEKNLAELQRRLPSKAEIASLIQEISQQTIASGLKSELFKPNNPQKDGNGVYEKYPIQLKLTGDYHSFGKFISGIAAMPRIVTQHEVVIEPASKGKESELSISLIAQIYRYIDEEEIAAEEAAKAAAKPAAKGKK